MPPETGFPCDSLGCVALSGDPGPRSLTAQAQRFPVSPSHKRSMLGEHSTTLGLCILHLAFRPFIVITFVPFVAIGFRNRKRNGPRGVQASVNKAKQRCWRLISATSVTPCGVLHTSVMNGCHAPSPPVETDRTILTPEYLRPSGSKCSAG
jgi:hypothetical protein